MPAFKGDAKPYINIAQLSHALLFRFKSEFPHHRGLSLATCIKYRTLSMSSIKLEQGLARKYEINADMGEGFGRWKMARPPYLRFTQTTS